MLNALPFQAVWLMDPKEVTPELHNEFFRYIANSYDLPRFCLHYHTDSPLNLRCLLYIPEGKPGLFEMSRDLEVGVALYSHRVLIKSKADILPKWLRFMRGEFYFFIKVIKNVIKCFFL